MSTFIVNEISSLINDTLKDDHMESALETVQRIVQLSEDTKRERLGLLYLEDKANELKDSDSVRDRNLSKMITYVVDGTEPDLIKEMLINRYYADAMKEEEALVYLLQMAGVLAIQSAEYPKVTEERLLMMLPSEWEKIYWQKQDEASKVGPDEKEERDRSRIESFCDMDASLKPEDTGYFTVMTADKTIQRLSDRTMQRILMDMEVPDLALALQHLGSQSKRKVIGNLSRNVALMTIEEAELPITMIRYKHSIFRLKKMMDVIAGLAESGEIALGEAEPFMEMHMALRVDSELMDKQTEAVKELENILRAYKDRYYKEP